VRRVALLLLLAVLAACGAALRGEAPSREGRVQRVVDGDTLVVIVRGREETVRLIGIDTPERAPHECGYRAATRALERLAEGRRVELVPDPTQDRRDRYGRLLAYVDTPAGRDLGEAVVRAGWARVYVFEDPFARLADYRAARRAAVEQRVGLAAACA
jgi:micrococcal nuclease